MTETVAVTRHEPTNVAGMARSGRLRLAIGLSAAAVVWLIVLPRMAATDGVREYLRRLDERHINAGAMYYTELEAMTPILQRLHGRPCEGAAVQP